MAAPGRLGSWLDVTDERAIVAGPGQLQARAGEVADALQQRFVQGPAGTAGTPDNHQVQPNVAGLGQEWRQRSQRVAVRYERPSGTRESTPAAGRLALALPGAATSAALAALVAGILPAAGAFEPRQLVTPPPLPLVERNPMPRMAALVAQDRELFRHTAGERRLHLVALSEFNGAAWEADAVYRPVGAVAETLPTGAVRTEVSAEVAIEELDGPWLPATGVPAEVSLDGARVDAESGSLVLAGGLRSGLRYQVRGLVDTPDDSQLVVAGVPPVDRYLAVPRLPFLFADYAQQIVRGASTPFEQAVLIETAVRDRRQVNMNAPAGSSYARLETFLFGPAGLSGARIGTSEQFATAFAVLARAAGLPTRIMVGFGPGQQQPDGTWLVRGRDALAWPEIYFSGHGWVPFDPTPQTQDNTAPGSAAKREVVSRMGLEQAAPKPPPAPVRPAATASPAPITPVPDPAGPDPTDDMSWVARSAVAVIVLAFAALLVAKGVRRGRHRLAGAGGAWSEVLDLCVLLDRRPAPWHTAVRIAADLAADVPAATPHPVWRLAEYADRATFCPEPSPVDDPWPELRRLRRAVRRGTPWYRRLGWLLDPRPIWRR